jgi:hypothetical protein
MNARTLARATGAALALAAAAPLVPASATAAHAQAPAARPVASPRDTAEASVAGARVMVDYGRPYKRGRQIYGNLVPSNTVWRTGANASTTLVTDRPLRMGSTTIPAGKYSLYSLWTGSAWNLIVNKQTGQWGTEYDQTQDLARIPLKVSTVKAPVEQFTIAVEPKGKSGVLSLTWDDKRGEVPFTVAAK